LREDEVEHLALVHRGAASEVGRRAGIAAEGLECAGALPYPVRVLVEGALRLQVAQQEPGDLRAVVERPVHRQRLECDVGELPVAGGSQAGDRGGQFVG
jgi:hypothetical protein